MDYQQHNRQLGYGIVVYSFRILFLWSSAILSFLGLCGENWASKHSIVYKPTFFVRVFYSILPNLDQISYTTVLWWSVR